MIATAPRIAEAAHADSLHYGSDAAPVPSRSDGRSRRTKRHTARLLCLAATVLGILIWSLASSATSSSDAVDIRAHLCFGSEADQPASLRFSSGCETRGAAAEGQWNWAYLDNPRRLDALESGWHVMLPHRQLDDVTVIISYRDGTAARIERLGGGLAVDWSPLGHAAFAVPRPGQDVAALTIGFRARSGDSALRYVKALPAPVFAQQAANFQLVVGLFLGAVGSALIYNLFLGGGFRQSFQGIYAIWGSLALLNGLLASGLLTGLWPALLGPSGIVANRMVLALLFASGILFLLALIERGILPRALVRLSLVTAAAIAATAPLALAESWLPPGLLGRATSLLMALNIVVIIVVATVAVGRGSRAAWFYLAGWAPILAFGLVLIAFEAGLIAHSQLLDLGGMLALAFESVVFSLAMADRFRRLQREHDDLESATVVAEAERAALQQVADTDQLTGLSNRRAFEALLAAARKGEIDRLALILIDIDHFKSINDRFGHEEGDDLLREIADRLRSSVRADDVVARLGGDEFAILLTGSDARHADQVIRGLLAVQRHAAHPDRQVTFSIGAALLPDDDADPTNLYKNADLALYEAKRLGRARAQRYRPALRTRDQQRLAAPQEERCVASETSPAGLLLP